MLLRFRVGDLLSEVAWAVEEGGGDGADGSDPHADPALQLGTLVDSLVRAVRRLIRKWHRLSARLGDAPLLALPPPQQRQQVAAGGPASSCSGGQENARPAASAASSGECSVSAGAGGWCGSVAHEAGIKAARIAATLDRMLTPHSRAAARSRGGGSSGLGLLGGGSSRFAVAADDAEDEVPLRERYGRRSASLL